VLFWCEVRAKISYNYQKIELLMEKLKNSTILYIEDDEITRENISSFLKRKCKNFFVAVDGKEGLELFEKHNPDIIITDIEMPNLDGLSMAKKIRKMSASTQIIITTAYASQDYLIEAVNLHLIKYIVKPISLPKLNAALADCENFLEDSVITKIDFNQNIFYDTYTKELVKKNEIISLSKTERALLDLLIKNHPAPTSYEGIESNVYEFASSKNAIKLLVKSLRSKIDKEAISNVSGFGYNVNIEKE
jgi:DNA-binding response OmpR family regulator